MPPTNCKFLTWTIFGHCLPVTKCPFKSMTIKVRSLSQPDLRPNFVHSSELTRTGPSDLTGYTTRSLNSPTFRHSDGGRSFCLLVHHHQKKTTTVPAPTTAADTYVNRVLSARQTFSHINSLSTVKWPCKTARCEIGSQPRANIIDNTRIK